MVSMEEKLIGKRLDGRYEIHELLGMGGMAHVYRAYDKVEDRWVAIKVLKEEFLNNSDFLRRFRNESKAIAVLQHPNIVRVYDVSLGDQIQYIAMEYIDGITLKDYIDQQGAIRWQEALHFMIQILSALESAHEKGIIHRDIKPQNIMLLRDGTIKVTDFGIARFLQSETQTMTDKAIGSVHYISPEQARGDYITDKADIYSVGVTMYEMLTGELPFNADSAVSVALMQLQAKPRLPSEINPTIPRGLEQIVMKAMEKNPPDRFRSVAEMLDDIDRFRQNPNLVFNYAYTAEGYKEPSNIDNYETVPSPDYDDNYEYEEELVKSKRRRKGSMAVTGVIVALVIVLAAAGVMLAINAWNNMQTEDDTVEVPDFMGKVWADEVQGNSEYADFEFDIQPGNVTDQEPGVITNQSPVAGRMVRKGRTITLYVNKYGVDTVTLTDVTKLEMQKAIEALQAQNLKTTIIEISDNNVEEGYVIKTDPVAGSEVEEGSTVTVYVSTGPEEKKVNIPSGLVGDTLSNVQAKLVALNLEVSVTYDDTSTEEKDVVLKVTPAAGEEVSEGSSVTVVVSSGSKVQKTVTYPMALPSVNADINIKVYQNGTLIKNETVNPALRSTYDIKLTGTVNTTDSVVVQLDGQDYYYITFDYTKEEANPTRKFDYVPKSSSSSSSSSSEPSSSTSDNGGGDTTTNEEVNIDRDGE